MALKTWSSQYPTDLDTNTEQPTLVNEDDQTDVSQIHAMRTAVQALEVEVGSDNLEAGSLRAEMATAVSDISTAESNITSLETSRTLRLSIDEAITAFNGGGSGSATVLTSRYNQVDTAVSHLDSVRISSSAVQGEIYTVENNTSVDVGVYPPTGNDMVGYGTDTVYPLAAGSSQDFIVLSSGNVKPLKRGRYFVRVSGGPVVVLTQAGMTADNAFHNLDLTTYIPPSGRLHGASPGARANFRLDITSSSFRQLQLSTATAGESLALFTTSVSSNLRWETGELTVPADGIFRYKLSGAVTTANIALEGYWVEG